MTGSRIRTVGAGYDTLRMFPMAGLGAIHSFEREIRGLTPVRSLPVPDNGWCTEGNRMSSRLRNLVNTRQRRLAVAGSALVVAALVSGCGPTQAGSAAIVGDTRITDVELGDKATEIETALNLPPSARVNQVLLDQFISQAIYLELAERLAADVGDGEVEAFIADQAKLAGGYDKLKEQLLRQGILEDQIPVAAKIFLLRQVLAKKLANGKSPEEQNQIVAAAAIKLSNELNIRVSPRFGTWDPATLRVGPTPNTLSVPAPNSSNQMSELVQQ